MAESILLNTSLPWLLSAYLAGSYLNINICARLLNILLFVPLSDELKQQLHIVSRLLTPRTWRGSPVLLSLLVPA